MILLLENGDTLLLESSAGGILLQAESTAAVGMGIKARPAGADGPASLLQCEDFPPIDLENGDQLYLEDGSGDLSLQSIGAILFLESGFGGLIVQTDSIDPKTTVVVRVTKGGSGYTSPPTVTIPGVTARAIVGNQTQAGQVVAVVVTSISGTPVDPLTVTFSGGGGSGAEAIARTISVASQTATQDPPFQVRTIYGALLIDNIQGSGASGAGSPSTLEGLQDPPIKQPALEAGMLPVSAKPEDLLAALKGIVHARAWNVWFQELQRLVLAQGAGVEAGSEYQFTAPSVDETDAQWWAEFGADVDDSTDPLTVACTFKGESRYGMQFSVVAGGTGYIPADPPTVMVSGTAGSGTGAVVQVVIDDASGQIVDVQATSSGQGYVGPLSVSLTGGSGSGALVNGSIGRQWLVGDYVLVNDPNVPSGSQQRSYEIMKITAIDGGDVTFQRRASAAPAGQSQYGSLTREHAKGIQLYRLINKVFTAKPQSGAGPQSFVFPWPNMTIPAVRALLPGKDPITLNFTPRVYVPNTDPPLLDPRTNPPAPGLRTMNGAAYISMGQLGTLSVGQTAIARIVGVQAPESIRCLYMRTRTAPIGASSFAGDDGACIVAYVVYIGPSGQCGLIDTLIIDQGNFDSYSDGNVPDGRVMPYHSFFPLSGKTCDWPPNRLPLINGALNSSGNLVKPLTQSDVDPSDTVLFSPDGQIDFIIGQVGLTTPGSDLILAVQT